MITALFSDLATHAYSCCGDVVPIKMVGIPEGYEASPPMSNIFLSWWPLKEMLRMLRDGHHEVVASLANTFRQYKDKKYLIQMQSLLNIKMRIVGGQHPSMFGIPFEFVQHS